MPKIDPAYCKPYIYYLAYGSNLDCGRIRRRCPYAVAVGTTRILGYGLRFRKSKSGFYATIEPSADEFVPVAVWRISKYDELLLDYYEGAPTWYYKKRFKISTSKPQKRELNAITYVMPDGREAGSPSKEYLKLIYNGYTEWGFDPVILRNGLSASIGKGKTDLFYTEFKRWRTKGYEDMPEMRKIV